MEYCIKGIVDTENLQDVLQKGPIVAYAVRDRRVLGSARVKENGRFEIKYKYKCFGKDQKPYGVDLIIGPELPGDQILKTEFERRYLNSNGFKKVNPWEYTILEKIELLDQWKIHFDDIYWKKKCEFTYTGFVYTCSPLNIPPGGQAGCVSQDALSSAEAEAYIRLTRIPTGKIIAEDIEIDLTGKFEHTHTYSSLICFYLPVHAGVEVYQKTDEGDHILYTGNHTFNHNIAVDIFIDRDKVEIITKPPNPTPGTANYFGFERVGNIPVECIYKAGDPDLPSDGFIGYVDSSGDRPGITLGDADLKVKDYAFGDYLHLYANIGEEFSESYPGTVDMSNVKIKYYRIKYSYYNPETEETIGDTYLSLPFYNTRKTPTGTAAEFMGALNTHPDTSVPLTQPTYIYPNPYETAANKNWKYRGLIYVLNTYALPRKYGLYTFTIEPLDSDMNLVSVADTDDCVLQLLIDNDHAALTGKIEDILKDSISTPVCGIIDLTGTAWCAKTILKVKYTVKDAHGNLRAFTLTAHYGVDKEIKFALTGNTYSRSGTTPIWEGVENQETSKDHAWEQCAYEFRIVASRRVTNGYYTITWKEFTYHITIINPNTPYETICP